MGKNDQISVGYQLPEITKKYVSIIDSIFDTKNQTGL